MNNFLTIMIPTYNRRKELECVLTSLMNQTNQSFDILISDNCSNYDVHEVIKSFSCFNGRINVIVHKTNIGAQANFTSLFENVSTKWAWLLGDDDFPDKDAVEIIINNLDDSLCALHFSIYPLEMYGVDKFIDILDLKSFVSFYSSLSFGKKRILNAQGDLICMSNKVYNMSIMKKYLPIQSQFDYTKIHQIINIFAALDNNDGSFRICNHNFLSISDVSNQSWRIENVTLGLTTFSHIPFKSLDTVQRKRLDLIVMFYYTHILKYWLMGEISKTNVLYFYYSFFRKRLSFKERMTYRTLTLLRPKKGLAKVLIRTNDKK